MITGKNRSRRFHAGKRRRRARRSRSAMFSPDDSPDEAKINVGASLRGLREEQDLTIRALAEISGLNVNTLSLIENGKSSPSVNTLQRLAAALDVPIVTFFEYGQPQHAIVFHKAGKQPQAILTHGTVEDLGMGLKDSPFEAMVIEINPGADSGDKPIVHTGHELVFCLEGQVLYEIAGQDFTLEPGDSLCFEAFLPHRWSNVRPDAARAILVMCPADEYDQPTERHFLEEVE